MENKEKQLKEYNDGLLKNLSTNDILSNADVEKLKKNMPAIQHSLKYAQMFRTDIESRVSVLNDVKFPDADSKYWQSMRELKVQSNELFYLNFNYEEKIIDIEEIELKLSKLYDNEFEKRRDIIKLKKMKYELLQMELTAKDRMREIEMWVTLQTELTKNMKHSNSDINEHQLISFGLRFINEYVAAVKMGANASPSEARNLMGLLTSTINKINEDGKLDLLVSQVSPDNIKILIEHGIITPLVQ